MPPYMMSYLKMHITSALAIFSIVFFLFHNQSSDFSSSEKNSRTSSAVQPRARQILPINSTDTGSCHPILTIVLELIPAFSHKSFFFIFLSIRSLKSLLYEIFITLSTSSNLGIIWLQIFRVYCTSFIVEYKVKILLFEKFFCSFLRFLSFASNAFLIRKGSKS